MGILKDFARSLGKPPPDPEYSRSDDEESGGLPESDASQHGECGRDNDDTENQQPDTHVEHQKSLPSEPNASVPSLIRYKGSEPGTHRYPQEDPGPHVFFVNA